MIIKPILCGLLATLQVLICTVGQGALTLCVRKDGTQQVEWTWATSCSETKAEGSCHCGCGKNENSDEGPSSSPTTASLDRACDSCTDYLLVVVQPSVTVEKNPSQAIEQQYFPDLQIAIELGLKNSISFSKTSALSRLHLTDSFAAIASMVVIRC